jgi:hypothetical protein
MFATYLINLKESSYAYRNAALERAPFPQQ